MTARIFLKLLLGFFCLLLVALVAVDFWTTRVAQASYQQNLVRELAEKGRMLAIALPDPATLSRQQMQEMAQAVGGRVTVVAPDGRVLADSSAEPAKMENHRTRPELTEALGGKQGWRVRHSATLDVDFLYVAVPVPAGAVRVAVPLSEINNQVGVIRGRILGSAALAFLPAILLAALLARSISRRFGTIIDFASELAKGNFRARLGHVGGGEFGQLRRTLNETAENLQKTVEQLHAEHTELEKLERVRKDFVINVSHELRTPLASIQGYAETLMDGALEDRDNNLRFLGIIRHNAERLARLTEDLLTLSRIELRRHEFRFDSYQLSELVLSALDTVRPIAEKKRIELVHDATAVDHEVFCDAEAVSQILSNLLDNAIKYTPERGNITVGAESEDPWMRIFVRDTGMGIPSEDLPRLFERFYRVDKARSRALGGTGLGLSIVKHLVYAHKGRVWVESQPGRGSSFYFTLPLKNLGLEAPKELNPEFTAS